MKKDNYLLLTLYLPALYIFYNVVNWAFCKPVTEVNKYLDLLKPGETIPEEATCFATNHMSYLTFFSYPPIKENIISFGALVILLLICVIFTLPATLRLFHAIRNT
nr:hypothetical protein [uncultured bacterium]